MPLTILVIIALLEGSACYVIAEKKGLRYPWLWFTSGITLHVIAFVVLYFAIKFVSSDQEVVSSNREEEEATHEEFT